VNFVAVKRDITRELELESQLRQAQKLEAIGTLASGVAHEINNQVMGVMNYAQLIKDDLGQSHPEIRGYADEIVHETERVAVIVRNLLHFARQEGDASQRPTAMADIVESTLSLMRTVVRRDQIALLVEVPRGLPQVRCRGQQIQQVIMNLLTNARDALNEKYPGSHADKTIRVTARAVDGDATLRVRTTIEDRGTGIPEALRERIFEPFFTTKGRDRGTGLGLAISHGIAKDHGGQLTVESEVGQWTRFHLDLPAEPALEP
jgi:signal transduction histidine kinase